MGLFDFFKKKKKDSKSKVEDNNDIFYWVGWGNYEESKKLIELGSNVNDKDSGGTPLLSKACLEGAIDVVKLLVENNADVNARDKSLWTPIMWAISNRHRDVVKYLLDNGADPTVKSHTGMTPMEQAKDSDIKELLIECATKKKKVSLNDSIIPPSWLIQLVANNTARHGRNYVQKVHEGYLEVPDWAYHLRSSNGGRMSDNQADFQVFFDKVFDEGMSKQHSDSNYVTINVGGAAKLLMVTGTVIQKNLVKVGMDKKYKWEPQK